MSGQPGHPKRCDSGRDQWRVLDRNCNYSAFNGYHYTPSAYSYVVCTKCGEGWRTRAGYVDSLANISREAWLASPRGRP